MRRHLTPILSAPSSRRNLKTRSPRATIFVFARRGRQDMSALLQRFGRPLRLGVAGGGPESWIGRMHRTSAELDGLWKCVAGVFSSDAERSRAAGATLGFARDRSYGSVQEMLAAERQ